MTLPPQYGLENFDSVSDWIEDLAEGSNKDKHEIWDIVEQIVLDSENFDNYKIETKLKLLLEQYLDKVDNQHQTPPMWVNIYFPERQIQFTNGRFGIDIQSEEEKLAIKKLARQEDLEIALIEEEYVATEGTEGDAMWALEILLKVATDVYGFDLRDIRGAEHGGPGADTLTLDSVGELG
jgi:hypothetical protein